MGIRAYSFRTGQERIVVSSRSNAAFMEDLSPDGRWVLYNTTDPSGIKRNISLLDLVSGKSEPIFGTRPALDAQFSPDGRWVAFTSNESGRNEIYVMSLRARMPIRVTREGGSQPVWRGGELYYRGPSRVLMVIPIELAEHPRFGASRVALLDPSYEDLRVSSDARVLYGLQFEMRRAMALIQNWPARLESR
jgi:tricorn protease-like protein